MVTGRRVFVALVITTGLIFFQNCSQVGFSTSGATLVAANTTNPNGSTPPNAPSTGGGGPTAGNGGTSGGTIASPPPTENPENELVECDLGDANAKVAIDTSALQGQTSNSCVSRVCMSTNACLNLINAYAEKRGCTLAVGAETTPAATVVCTEIFPGSVGTCNKASTVLTDAQVIALLASMAK